MSAESNPTVVLVRRFYPDDDELPRWDLLYSDDDGVTSFSPAEAEAAALAPPRDADLYAGDLIVTVPLEAAPFPEEYATGLYVVTPDGVMAQPEPHPMRTCQWFKFWGQGPYSMIEVCHPVERRRIVMAACDCAEMALNLVPSGEERPRIAIETARAWCLGRASTDDVLVAVDNAKIAADDALDALRVVEATDASAKTSARSALSAACAAYCAALAVIAETPGEAWSAANGVLQHVSRSTGGTRIDDVHRAMASLIERWIPLPVVLLSWLGYDMISSELEPDAANTANASNTPVSTP
jgi:hypothetical protein